MNTKIITITLSPCIDKSTTVDRFLPEKKLRCSYPVLEAGGGGINVSRVLKNFGKASQCLYISGGYTGKILDELVHHEHLDFSSFPSDLYTRENFIVFEKQTHLQFRFGMPVNKLPEKEWKPLVAFLNKHKAAQYLVLSGSINEHVSPLFFKEIRKYVNKNQCKLIVDTSGKALKKVVAEGAFIIKPNLNEFSSLFGTKLLPYKLLVPKAKQLIARGKIENIIISLGPDGALLVNKKDAIHFLPPPLKIKSTVGAGDSTVAGTVYQLCLNKSVSQAVKFGVASGSATTINSGMGLCSLSGAKKMLGRILEHPAKF